MSTETVMKAAVVHRAGEAPRLAHVPRPHAGPGQALVRICASGVNPLDLKIAAGAAAHAKQPLPAVLGMDLAGVVIDVGAGVSELAVGDEVYGLVGGVGGHQGTLAEVAAVDAALLARKPSNLTMREAAAMPLVLVTAWEGLVERASVGEDQSVLVLGAGGVGQMAIQLAQARGARVFAVDDRARLRVVEQLGATAIERGADVASYVEALTAGRGFDVVYDSVGALDAAFRAVRRGGHVVSSLGWGTHALAPLSFKAATYSGVFTLLPLLTGEDRARHGSILREGAALAQRGRLAPRLDPRRFSLDGAADAHRFLREGKPDGKVVVDVAP